LSHALIIDHTTSVIALAVVSSHVEARAAAAAAGSAEATADIVHHELEAC